MLLLRSISLFVFLLPLFLVAQTNSYLVTGRPSNTAGPYTVEPGMFQLEAGLTLESSQRQDQGLRFYNLSVPGIDFRMGISPNTEFNIGLVEKVDFLGNATKSGLGPITLGLKFDVYKSTNWLPTIALSSKIALPVGSVAFRPDYISPSLKLIFAHTLSRKSVLMYNLGAFWQSIPPVRGNYTLMYAYSFLPSLNAYTELYGGFTNQEDLTTNLGLGLAYAPTFNWQLDISGGFGLGNNRDARYIALGYSLRFFDAKIAKKE